MKRGVGGPVIERVGQDDLKPEEVNRGVEKESKKWEKKSARSK